MNQVWLQDKVQKKEIMLSKVSGAKNIADALTKHLVAEKLKEPVHAAHQCVMDGRHLLMPKCEV